MQFYDILHMSNWDEPLYGSNTDRFGLVQILFRSEALQRQIAAMA